MREALKFLILLVVAGSTSCNNPKSVKVLRQAGSIRKAAWIIGRWQHRDEEGMLIEVWDKKDDTLYSGFSFFIKGNDTISSETITLQQRGKELHYIPVV